MAHSLQNIQVNKITQSLPITLRNILALRMTDVHLLMTLLFCLLLHLPAEAQDLSTSDIKENEPIKIGLLLTENPSENSLMQEAMDAANLIVDQVNKSGGIRQKQIRLFMKSTDGKWGTGSKQAVSLIFEHQTTALLGFIDGRSAHLIEQVCTKAEIPFISTHSPDPTLSRINIPWYFSTVPLADQQANILAEHLVRNNFGKSILIVTSDDYDQGFIRRSFIEMMVNEYHIKSDIFNLNGGKDDFNQIRSVISESGTSAIVFFGTSVELEILTEQLEVGNIEIPVYTSIHNLKRKPPNPFSNPVFAIRSKNLNTVKKEQFHKDFFDKYGYTPGVYVSYLYDGMQALFEAIRINSSESHQIRKSLAKMKYKGMNGQITFGSDGVIEQPLTIVKIGGGG
jgi:branched-chain amino acid transport system substrate-binding protein